MYKESTKQIDIKLLQNNEQSIVFIFTNTLHTWYILFYPPLIRPYTHRQRHFTSCAKNIFLTFQSSSSSKGHSNWVPGLSKKNLFFYRRLPVLQQCRGRRCSWWCKCRRKCRRRHPQTITAFTHTPTCDRCLGNCLPPSTAYSLYLAFFVLMSPPAPEEEEEEEIRPFPKRPGGISLLPQPRLEN